MGNLNDVVFFCIQVIQTVDEKTGEKVSVSRKCADINATVPDMVSFFSSGNYGRLD